MHHAESFLEQLDDIPVSAQVTYEELKAQLATHIICLDGSVHQSA